MYCNLNLQFCGAKFCLNALKIIIPKHRVSVSTSFWFPLKFCYLSQSLYFDNVHGMSCLMSLSVIGAGRKTKALRILIFLEMVGIDPRKIRKIQ